MLPNPQETSNLVTFTEEILNGKLHFLSTDFAEELFYLKIWLILVSIFFRGLFFTSTDEIISGNFTPFHFCQKSKF